MGRSRSVVLMSVVLVAVWASFVSGPAAQSNRAIEVSVAHFNANRGTYGLANPSAELRLRRNRPDSLGTSHVKFDQLYRGLPVFEGEAIAHVDAGGSVTVTSALRGNLNVATNARIGRGAAIRTAVGFIAPAGAYQVRDASLWILPRGENSVADRLVWHVAVAVENELEDPEEWRYFVDAQNGLVIWSFDSLKTADVPLAVARTMYSSDPRVHADLSGGKYLLRDLTKGSSATCDMNNRNGGSCTVFSRPTAVFGNNRLDNSDRATAGADAHFGLQATWDFYRITFGRDGIDGNSRRTSSRVHYGRNYENAFWSDSCFCMTYGDGAATFYPLVSLDVAGHEMSHGVMSTEANLTYAGESGGLNESSSDIFGTLVEHFVNGSTDVPDYWIGERIYRSNYPGGTYTQTKALRYMDDPAKDGRSPACWYPGIGSLNVHYSSGPNNHMFYLLANGGTSKCDGSVVSGIGTYKAALVWYKAITDYMTASTNYAAARTAAVKAADVLFGVDSPESYAVKTAYAAINVK